MLDKGGKTSRKAKANLMLCPLDVSVTPSKVKARLITAPGLSDVIVHFLSYIQDLLAPMYEYLFKL